MTKAIEIFKIVLDTAKTEPKNSVVKTLNSQKKIEESIKKNMTTQHKNIREKWVTLKRIIND